MQTSYCEVSDGAGMFLMLQNRGRVVGQDASLRRGVRMAGHVLIAGDAGKFACSSEEGRREGRPVADGRRMGDKFGDAKLSDDTLAQIEVEANETLISHPGEILRCIGRVRSPARVN